MKLIIPLAFASILYQECSLNWPYPKEWIAAQIQIESAWDAEARSSYATGLAQFTDATWGDWAPRSSPPCSATSPTDPTCAIRVQITYMSYLLTRTSDRHTAWRAYNGGIGWIYRERRSCASSPGCDPRNPLHLERFCRAVGRSLSSCRENIAYPRKIARLL